MSATTALLLVLVAWVTIGVIAAVFMGRRGHAPFSWGALGAVLGPLVIPLALGDVKREREAHAVTLSKGESGSGPVDVLVGIDGSQAALAALTAALDLLGDRVGSITLAAVLDYDTAQSDRPWSERDHAEAALADAAELATQRTGRAPTTTVLAGVPAHALADHAVEAGAELLAIGSRGHGATKAVLGSVATHLAASAPIPVLVFAERSPSS
ncbi:MAG TPA: universal stress protein [Acidimicrobiia bacterium]|nr:universal stress protein [Acidimicrobiia bacterium]